MSGPLRDTEREYLPSRAAEHLERLRRLVAVRDEATGEINAEIDFLAARGAVSFRVIAKVLGQPAWMAARDYEVRHTPPGPAAG